MIKGYDLHVDTEGAEEAIEAFEMMVKLSKKK
jgi:hypothetical protein